MEEHDKSFEHEKAKELSKEEQETSGQAKTEDESAPLDIQQLNDKYLRLYANFENYRKRVNSEKEELIKYGNESLLYELLPAIDNLELALKHASGDSDDSLVQGVEMTLKELHRTLEKFNLTPIEAEGKPFDPAIHHAMIQVEREDMDEKMVAEELRTGYMYGDKVLRPALVAVTIRPKKEVKKGKEPGETGSEDIEIRINKDTEEES